MPAILANFSVKLKAVPASPTGANFVATCPNPPDIAPGAAAKIPALKGLPSPSVAADVAAAINALCPNAVPSPLPNALPAIPGPKPAAI